MPKKNSSIGNDRVALVTGATGIIGPTICEVLKRDGWRVAACASSRQSFPEHEKIYRRRVKAHGEFVARLDAGRDACHRLVREIENTV